MRRVAAILLFALLVAATVAYLSGGARRAVTATDGQALRVLPSAAASDPLIARQRPAAPYKEIAEPAVLQTPASIYSRYEAATDLLPLAQELRERVRHGDAAAVGPLDRIEDECLMFMVSPGTRAGVSDIPDMQEKVDPSMTGPIEAALARRTARCQRFTRSDLIERGQREILLGEAASKGDPQAQARWLVYADLVHVPDATLIADVKNVVASGDPEAINDLSPVMSERVAGREQLFDLPSGSEVASWAWVGAACKLGLDCGPHGFELQQLCLTGPCYPSVDDYIREALLTPMQYRQMLHDEQKILAAVGRRH